MQITSLRPVTNVAVLGSRHQNHYIGKIAELLRLLNEAGIKTELEQHFGTYLQENGLPLTGNFVNKPSDDCGAVISIGGDGTFLRSARWVERRCIPVLGINTGHLGYLTSFTLEDIKDIPSRLLNGDALVEPRSLLRVECDRLPSDVWPYALNEVTISKDDTSSMITVTATIDDFYLADYLCDGLIVATPTGSTAYNLSAGGPLLQPTLDCMVLSPIAPHSLTMRPLVVDGASRLKLCGKTRATQFRVSLDNRSFTVDNNTELRVSRGEFQTYIVRKPGSGFATILRSKLHWGT